MGSKGKIQWKKWKDWLYIGENKQKIELTVQAKWYCNLKYRKKNNLAWDIKNIVRHFYVSNILQKLSPNTKYKMAKSEN